MKATTVYQLNLAIFLVQNWNERLPAEPKSLFLFRTAATLYLLYLRIFDTVLVQDRDDRISAEPSHYRYLSF